MVVRVSETSSLGTSARVKYVVLALALATVAAPLAEARVIQRECSALFAAANDRKVTSTKLIIEITNQPLIELVPGTNRETWPPVVKIRNAAGEITLHALQDLSAENPVLSAISKRAHVEVIVVSNDGSRRELELPGGLKKSLREYIRAGGPPTKPFNCNCFVHLMNGLPYDYTYFRSRLWHLETVIDEMALAVGDTIVLGYSYAEIKHVAIYLGQGLYISKMGDGPVLVTDFSTLQLGYGGFMLGRGRPAPPIRRRSPAKENAN